MGWIKRNLFFVIGGLIALLLLVAAGYYDYRSWDHNSSTFDQLNEIYGKLKELNDKKPSPGNAKIDNIKQAKEQTAIVREWIERAGQYFQPIAAIPPGGGVSSEAFAAALRRTIDQLQHAADDASVQLPPKYSFSFEAQRTTVRFADGSLDPLSEQLGEVKTIAEIFFAARVNALDGIQRVRVSADDSNGPQTDYLGEVSMTNNLAVITPYAITFRCFSPELAGVLAGFAASPHGMVVKAVNIAPAGATAQPGGSVPPPFQPAMPIPPTVTGAGRGGLPTVLKEQLLRVTLEVEIVKPLPKK